MQCTFGIVCILAFVAGTSAQILQANGTHHGHSENDGFLFSYDGITHLMIVRSAANACYIWQITDDEKNSVHTDAGLRSIELRIVTEIDNRLYTVVPKAILNPSIIKNCAIGVHHHNAASISYNLVH